MDKTLLINYGKKTLILIGIVFAILLIPYAGFSFQLFIFTLLGFFAVAGVMIWYFQNKQAKTLSWRCKTCETEFNIKLKEHLTAKSIDEYTKFLYCPKCKDVKECGAIDRDNSLINNEIKGA